MIFEELVMLFMAMLERFLTSLPFADIVIPQPHLDIFFEYLQAAAYFIPIGTVAILLGCIIAEELVKINIALIKFLLKFIPFMG